LVTGGAAIIAGGLVAAVTGPTGWDHGSWVAAFLVLVTGVAQIGVGAAQAQLARTAPTVAYVATECGVWNGSCIVVIAGTLLSSPATVTAGSALLLVALGMSASAVRQSGRSSLLRLYRTLLIGLLASTPIGIALAWARR
jgi:hypothetical protein